MGFSLRRGVIVTTVGGNMFRGLLALLLLAVALAAPAAALRIDEGTALYPLAHEATHYLDRDGRLTLEQVRAIARGDGFAPLPRERSNFGYVDGAMWFRFALERDGAGEAPWLLSIEYPLLDHVTLYRIGPDGAVSERESGDRTAFGTRDLDLRYLNFLVDVPPGAPTVFYLRAQSQSSMQVPLVLAQPDRYLERLLPSNLGLGLYYGVMVALLLYNLILWASVGDRNFLWYVLYVGALGVLLLCLNGLAFEFFWPTQPDWGNLAVPVFIALSNLCMLQFARSFLELERHAPRADRTVRGFMLAAGLPLLAVTVLPYRAVVQYQTFLALLIAPAIFVCGVLCLRRYAPARHFLVAWSALLIGVVVYAAVSLGVLPKNPFTEYSMQLGSAAEMILLSFALAYRINVLKAENERIQREARHHLEARVRARTAELDATLQRLEDANKRLQDFSRRDGLTGVYNRRHLDDALVALLQHARDHAEPISLLMIDVDHFKKINDDHGHVAGDDCLRAIAQGLDRIARGTGGTLARYGGEEFALLLPGHRLEQAQELAERLRAEVALRSVHCEGGRIDPTVSIGLYSVPAGYPCTAADVLRSADAALYAAKRAGRNRVEVGKLA
jgi:diguanylate cyclase (GGDEF)-like protein